MTKTDYYLGIARAVSQRATCLKKKYGALVVSGDRICSTGYNGVVSKEPHCTTCTKAPGNGDIEEYKSCPACHAEMNALLFSSKEEMNGADLYLAGFDVRTNLECDARPCEICLRLIKNAGINRIINSKGVIYKRSEHSELLLQLIEKE